MPSFRKPKGSYFRSTPDWFEGNAAWCGGPAVGSGGNPPLCALFNNDTGGSIFRVYSYVCDHSPTTAVYVELRQGKRAGVFSTAQAIRPDQAAPPGQFLAGAVAAPISFITALYQHNIGSPFSWQSYHGPLWEIPSGWSLEFYTLGANDVLSVTWWYVWLPDP
jgi:hypothetical protein